MAVAQGGTSGTSWLISTHALSYTDESDKVGRITLLMSGAHTVTGSNSMMAVTTLE